MVTLAPATNFDHFWHTGVQNMNKYFITSSRKGKAHTHTQSLICHLKRGIADNPEDRFRPNDKGSMQV